MMDGHHDSFWESSALMLMTERPPRRSVVCFKSASDSSPGSCHVAVVMDSNPSEFQVELTLTWASYRGDVPLQGVHQLCSNWTPGVSPGYPVAWCASRPALVLALTRPPSFKVLVNFGLSHDLVSVQVVLATTLAKCVMFYVTFIILKVALTSAV